MLIPLLDNLYHSPSKGAQFHPNKEKLTVNEHIFSPITIIRPTCVLFVILPRLKTVPYYYSIETYTTNSPTITYYQKLWRQKLSLIVSSTNTTPPLRLTMDLPPASCVDSNRVRTYFLHSHMQSFASCTLPSSLKTMFVGYSSRSWQRRPRLHI